MNFLSVLWFEYLINIVDILVVAYIFYRIILLVKGTRAVKILIGILILLFVTFLARDVVHLRTLSWLLENFWLAAVVIIAVVFQPEIRSALAQLGSQHWTKMFRMHEATFINEVVEAIKVLSSRKEGALIVIEKEIGLRDYLETGTKINAIVSEEIIISIFNKESPLHDGAIIIRDGIIVAAGCVLPLSSGDNKLTKSFGTRHSAGLGLSEETDAIVIIVSEESGKISIALNGKMTGDIDPDLLKQNLIDSFWEAGGKAVAPKAGIK